MKLKNNLGYIFIGLITSLLFFFLVGIPTDIIRNNYFKRMVLATKLDFFFLVASSVLLGVYVAFFFFLRKKRIKQKNISGYIGAIGSPIAISCPTCILLLVWIFGITTLLTYLEPIRHYIGFFSIGILVFGIYKKIDAYNNNCKECLL